MPLVVPVWMFTFTLFSHSSGACPYLEFNQCLTKTFSIPFSGYITTALIIWGVFTLIVTPIFLYLAKSGKLTVCSASLFGGVLGMIFIIPIVLVASQVLGFLALYFFIYGLLNGALSCALFWGVGFKAKAIKE